MAAIRIFSRGHLKNLLPLTQRSAHTRHTSSLNSTHLNNLKSMQATMQCEDGVPIYLKKGTRDRVLFGFSSILLIIGGIKSILFIGRWAKK